MNTHDLKVGDIVAIRGDKRINLNGKCAYFSEQLVDGKYLKHAFKDEIWKGRIEKIQPGEFGDVILVGGGWRGCEMYEKVPS